ncbi:hypothetical protein SteCoe_2191 [Stentor coeruleus]|uniref:Protein kinase domain-containing protein n=1 Tax=Stentor coeruleus TaxID=5963 RepID=A0A1R2CZZ4_9CILI|nr:hypothetical protein SteCoe_2191 [Stentor coeruleus]
MGCAVINHHKKKQHNSNPLSIKHLQYKNIEKEFQIKSFSSSNDYISIKHLGRGAFSEVMLCKHIPSQELRALKILRKNSLINAHFLSYGLLKEAVYLERINHPNILKFYDYFDDNLNYYIASEYCKEGSLYQKIRKNKTISEDQAAEIMFQIMLTIEYIHGQNIVHRDIKPENILIVNNESLNIKIGDFGNASYIKPGSKLIGGFGTPYYLAPEILKGPYDEKIDIWSCGILLYVLLTGKPPYPSRDSVSIKASILTKPFQVNDSNLKTSGLLKDFINKLLEIDPEKRASAEQALYHPWLSQVRNKSENLMNFISTSSKIDISPGTCSTMHFCKYDSKNLLEVEKSKDKFKDVDLNVMNMLKKAGLKEKQAGKGLLKQVADGNFSKKAVEYRMKFEGSEYKEKSTFSNGNLPDFVIKSRTLSMFS